MCQIPRMTSSRRFLTALLGGAALFSTACASGGARTAVPIGAAAAALRVYDSKANRFIPFTQLADAAAKADIVFFGEQHDDPATHASELIRLPGVSVARVLDAVLSVMPLDTFVAQGALTMQVVGDAEAVPPAVADMQAVLARHGCPPAGSLERFAFYERAAGAFAVVATGETRIYGNVILRKGVVLQGGDE